MLLRFQKAALRGNYETGNQAFSKRLRFLTIRGANAVAGCWPTPEEHIPSGSDRVRVGLFSTVIRLPASTLNSPFATRGP
jgi:hypothetical protein